MNDKPDEILNTEPFLNLLAKALNRRVESSTRVEVVVSLVISVEHYIVSHDTIYL